MSKNRHSIHFQESSGRTRFACTDAQWSDWVWQQQNRLRTLEAFESQLSLTESERMSFRECDHLYKVATTPYYAGLADPSDPNCPIRKQLLPGPSELLDSPGEEDDPLSEELQSPVNGLVHRYSNRALIYVTHNCPVYCRHCTRKRKVGNPATAPSQLQMTRAVEYIRQHPEINDVILSGGDPLSLSDDRLAEILEMIIGIPHVEFIRIGTRNLVTLPQRVTSDLVKMLERFQPIFMMTHFNHPKECTTEAFNAVRLLTDSGIPVYNQSVLLKGVNDHPNILKRLFHQLVRMGVKPYYLFQCDAAKGISHFRVPLVKALNLYREIEDSLSGLMVPRFVIDTPGGGGKVGITPERFAKTGDGQYEVLGADGKVYSYRD